MGLELYGPHINYSVSKADPIKEKPNKRPIKKRKIFRSLVLKAEAMSPPAVVTESADAIAEELEKKLLADEPILEDVKDDEEDDDDDEEEEEDDDAQGVSGSSKQIRSEKKSRKAMLKLGMNRAVPTL